MDEYTKKDRDDIFIRLEHEAGANGGHKAPTHVFPAAYGPGGITYGLQGTGQPDDVNGRSEASRLARRRTSLPIRREGIFTDDAVGDGTNDSAD